MGHLGYFGICYVFPHQTWHMDLRCVPYCFEIKTDTKIVNDDLTNDDIANILDIKSQFIEYMK